MAQARLEHGHRRSVGALLRGEDGGAPVGPQQRVADVDGQADPHLAQPGVEPGGIHRHDVGKLPAAQAHRIAVGVKKPEPQGQQGAAAAIGHGGPAQADDDLGGAGVERPEDQFPAPVAVGAQRALRGPGRGGQAGGLGRFDDRTRGAVRFPVQAPSARGFPGRAGP